MFTRVQTKQSVAHWLYASYTNQIECYFKNSTERYTLCYSNLSTPSLTMASASCWESTSVSSNLSRPLRIARYTGVDTLSSFPEAVETANCKNFTGFSYIFEKNTTVKVESFCSKLKQRCTITMAMTNLKNLAGKFQIFKIHMIIFHDIKTCGPHCQHVLLTCYTGPEIQIPYNTCTDR